MSFQQLRELSQGFQTYGNNYINFKKIYLKLIKKIKCRFQKNKYPDR